MIAVKDRSIAAIVLMAGSATTGYIIMDYQGGSSWRSIELGEWFDFFIEYNPLPTAEMVRCPVLILHGDQDTHVPVEHANVVAEAMRSSGNQDVTVIILPGYRHNFINIEEAKRKENEGKPADEILIISSEVIEGISDWMAAKLLIIDPS